MSFAKIAASSIALASVGTLAAARDQVQIAGSSTVLPYASIVAEAFGENTEFPTPVVESGGSSAGLKRFCEGIGENTIDIANASRKIRDREIEACAAAGVDDIVEVRIGYDGIVFASQQGGPDFDAFEPAQWYQAMAAEIPGADGTMAANTTETWSRHRPVAAGRPDPRLHPGHQARHPRGVRGEGHPPGLRGLRRDGAHDVRRHGRGRGRGCLHGDPHRRPRGRHRWRLHRDPGADRVRPRRRRRVRLVLLREQHRQAEGRDDERRHAVHRDDLLGRVPGVPARSTSTSRAPMSA